MVPCTERMPVVGDEVCTANEKHQCSDAAGNKDSWLLYPGEAAIVTAVDKDGDFQLRNPSGLTSVLQFRKKYVYREQDTGDALESGACLEVAAPANAEGIMEPPPPLEPGKGPHDETASTGPHGKGESKSKPPEGKGGKKGAPPASKNVDASGKAKGKGPDASLAAKGFKPDGFMVWHQEARSLHEDGHWGGEGLVGPMPFGASPLFGNADEKAAFLAECPYLSTLVMFELGKHCTEAFKPKTKQVREVQLGDGREHSDNVELKTVELTEDEKAIGQANLNAYLEGMQAPLDWEERVGKWLKENSPTADETRGSSTLEDRAKAVLALMKLSSSLKGREESARPRANTEQRAKREEDRKAKEAAMRKKEQDALAETAARMKRIRGLAPADINNVQWCNAEELHFVNGGSGGVMLVALKDSCVVLKQQGTTAAKELLAEHVADALGVRVAHVRVVKRGEGEYEEILASARTCKMFGTDPIMGFNTFFGIGQPDSEIEKLHEEMQKNAPLLAEAMSVAFFGILEYAPGHPLMGLDGNQVLASPAPDMLTELGSLCALDVLINNLDRVPLPVWQNEGNLGNVMAINGGKTIMGIDQQVNLIMPGPGRDKFIEKVRQTVKDCRPGGDSKGVVAKLQQAMMENCGAELSESNAQHVVAGLHKGFQTIANVFSSGKLKQSLDEAEKMCFDRLIVDGSCIGTKPQVDMTDAMKEFVCVVGSEVADTVSAE